MKKIILLFLTGLIFITSFETKCEENDEQRFSKKLDRFWKERNPDKAFKEGEARLQKNPYDLVGLILQMDKAIVKSDVELMTNTFEKLNKIASKIDTPNFKTHYIYWSKALPLMIDDLQKKSEEEQKNIRRRYSENAVPTSPLVKDLIEAMEEDGLISNEGKNSKALLELSKEASSSP